MNLRRVLAVAAVVLVAPVMSSCGVGFGAQTDQIYNPTAGTDDRTGEVDVLNVLIVSGTDGSGTLVATLVNNDQNRPDRLVRVSGSGRGGSVRVQMGGTTTVPAGGLVNLAKQGRIFVSSRDIVPGRFLQVTFAFQHAASATLQALVVSAQDPQYAGIPLPSSGSGSSSSPSSAASSSATSSAAPSGKPTASPSGKATATPSGTASATPSGKVSASPKH